MSNDCIDTISDPKCGDLNESERRWVYVDTKPANRFGSSGVIVPKTKGVNKCNIVDNA